MSTNEIDDFLNHKSSERGGSYLKSWKDNGSVVVWIHTKHVPKAVWIHPLPKVVVREDRNSGSPTREVWGGSYICYEREDTLKKQYKRTDSGQREFPPRRCPICRFVEWVRLMVESGKMNWCREVFRFDADDPQKTKVLHAGGLYNAFGARDLEDAQVKEMAKHGVYAKTAWRENAMAKLNYLFVVVNDDDPEAGPVVTTVTGLLGDKTKDVIRKAMNPKVLGPERGNPMISPYPICWVYDEKKTKFDEKYDAFRAENSKLTREIERAIRGPALDVSREVAPFDRDSMWAYLEAHCLLPKDKVPWERFFEAASEDDDESGLSVSSARSADRGPSEDSFSEPAPSKSTAPEEEMFACDECGKAMPASAKTCAHCGARYDVEAEPPAQEKVLPKRSAAKASVTRQSPATNAPERYPAINVSAGDKVSQEQTAPSTTYDYRATGAGGGDEGDGEFDEIPF